MRAHRLKCCQESFSHIRRGIKTADLRLADRDYRLGDFIMLVEYSMALEKRTGQYEFREITHVARAEDVPRGLVDGFVVLSMSPCSQIEISVMLGETESLTGPVEWIEPQ